MLPGEVTVLTDLAGAFLPQGRPAAVARFPDTDEGLRLRARVLDVLTVLGARVAEPVAAAAAYALGEPDASHRAADRRRTPARARWLSPRTAR